MLVWSKATNSRIVSATILLAVITVHGGMKFVLFLCTVNYYFHNIL